MADAIMNVRDRRKLGLLTIPGVLVSLLPALACPLGWPLYAALLSSLGLGFLTSSAYLLPLTGALLAIAVVGLALQARTVGYVPLVLGLASFAVIVPGKFILASDLMTFAGVALMAIASVWTLVPRRRTAPTSSPVTQGA